VLYSLYCMFAMRCCFPLPASSIPSESLGEIMSVLVSSTVHYQRPIHAQNKLTTLYQCTLVFNILLGHFRKLERSQIWICSNPRHQLRINPTQSLQVLQQCSAHISKLILRLSQVTVMNEHVNLPLCHVTPQPSRT
jgi:hypothetical protein